MGRHLDPDASEALRIAAVTHDIERAFPDPEATWDSARDWDSPAYNRWHQDRCADLVARLAARAGRRRRAGARHRRARPRARGRRLAGGGHAAGGRLALASSTRWSRSCSAGRERGYARQRGRQAAPLVGPDRARTRRAPARSRRRWSSARSPSSAPTAGSSRHGTPAADRRRAQTPSGCWPRPALVRSGPRVPARARALPRHAAVPRPPAVPGPLLPHAAGDPRGGRPALGAGQRRRARLHERARARQPAHGRAHRRARAHDGRGGRPLARRVGADAARRLRPARPGDATEIPPLWRRGVLYDVAGLPRGRRAARRRPGDGEEVRRSRRRTASPRGAGDVALFRTGYLERLAGPRARSPATAAPGPTSPPPGCSPSAA